MEGWDPRIPGGAAGLHGTIAGVLNADAFFMSQVQQDFVDPTTFSLMLGGYNVQQDQMGNPVVPDPDDIILEYTYLADRIRNRTISPQDQQRLAREALEVSSLVVGAANATWTAMNWQMPGGNTIQQMMNAYENLMNPFTITQMIQRWPHIQWPQMLLNIADGNVDLNHMFGNTIMVSYPSYFDWLDNVFATTDERVLRNFVIYKMVSDESPALPFLRDIYKKTERSKYERLGGVGSPKENPTDQGRCAYHVISNFPYLTGRIYADMVQFQQADLDELNEMIGLVLASWRGMITKVPWMSETSKQAAYSKIDMVARNVAYPSWTLNNAALAHYFRELNISLMDDTFLTFAKTQHWVANQQFSQIGSKVNRNMWTASPAIVNAWYAPWFNSITFPAAIMVSPMFNRTYPKAYNFAHVGSVMGHELGHGFDNSGVFFGPSGGFVNGSWLDPNSKSGFDKMAQCVIDEYSKFCLMLDGKKYCVNGALTLPENIADNGGMVASHGALMSFLQLMGGEPSLPQGYGALSAATSEQLFFISYGATWCSNPYAADLISQMQSDPHSPDQFRVTGVVQNMPQFAKAFNCPANSPMAPTDHCHVWVA